VRHCIIDMREVQVWPAADYATIRHRVTLKKRYGLLLTQLESTIHTPSVMTLPVRTHH
jgi:hypothetical protein